MSIKILIADDENLECDAFEFLASQSGFETTCIKAQNGREAVEKARLYRPQIIVLDIQMPLMNGLDAGEKIREFLPECIIVFLTAWGRFDFAQKALRLNAFDYLVKPVDENAVKTLLCNCAEKLKLDQKSKELKNLDIISSAKIQKETENLQKSILSGVLEDALKDEQILLDSIYSLYARTEQASNILYQLIPLFCYTIGKEIPYLEPPIVDSKSLSDLENIFAEYIQNATKAANIDKKDKYERIFNLITKYIGSHFMETLDTDTICNLFSLHPGYFPQLFKKYCNKTFVEYLTQKRMENAATCLKNGFSIKDAAQKSGFSDTNYFSKVFHKRYGCSPSEYK